jgi:hypothetical protein
MLYANSYDSAVKELRQYNIITNKGVLNQIVVKLRKSGNIKTPFLRHGGKRPGSGRPKINYEK